MDDPPAGAFHRTLRADPVSVRRTLTELRRCLGPLCHADALSRLELALAEVLNNVVEHGASGAGTTAPAGGAAPPARAVHLLVRVHAAKLTCTITDDGVLLPSACLAPRELPAREHELPEGGFGWFLIQDLVTELSYARSGNRNHLAFAIPLHDSCVAA